MGSLCYIFSVMTPRSRFFISHEHRISTIGCGFVDWHDDSEKNFDQQQSPMRMNDLISNAFL